MIQKKLIIEVEVTYDETCDMGYLYLFPKEKIPSGKGGAVLTEDKGKMLIVTDWRQERLVGIEFFGKSKFPQAIYDALFPNKLKRLTELSQEIGEDD